MRFKVIDGDKGFALRGGNRLARHHPDHHPADQAGARGGGDAVEIVERHAGILHRRLDQRIDMIEMRPRRNLRYYAAKGAMLLELAQHDIGPDGPVAVHDRGGGLVATGFDAEDKHEGVVAYGKTGFKTNA